MTRSLIPPAIRRLTAYVPGEQPRDRGFVKLNTNENPYPPSPKILPSILKAVKAAAGKLRLYPDPEAMSLRKTAARYYGVTPDRVIVGNGSDEILAMLFKAFVNPGDRVAFPVPTYTLYETLARIARVRMERIPFPRDFSLPETLLQSKAPLVILCNPNSPSGTLIPRAEVKRLARRIRGILVVDEAYVDFADENCLVLARECPNVVVLRTLSKSFSLAGLRAGFAIGPRPLIGALFKVKDSYNMDRIALAGAEAALRDTAGARRNIMKIRNTRERFTRQLRNLGFSVFPSQANFVLAACRPPVPPAETIYRALKSRRILIRYFRAPGLRDKLRITIGTDREMATLTNALEDILRRP
ncbi:MAG: histidinol-phosphate transaminase [Planctomycetota bacterium]